MSSFFGQSFDYNTFRVMRSIGASRLRSGSPHLLTVELPFQAMVRE